MNFTNDEWFIVKDIDGLINSSRALVFNSFGTTKDKADIVDMQISNKDKKELEDVLSFNESKIIILSLLKKQINKKTKDKRYMVNDRLFMSIIQSLNDRMTSNILNSLVNKGLVDTAYDPDANDFVFWIKNNENEEEIQKPETD